MAKPKKQQDKIKLEPGHANRLSTILQKALNTPPVHRPDRRTKKAPKAK